MASPEPTAAVSDAAPFTVTVPAGLDSTQFRFTDPRATVAAGRIRAIDANGAAPFLGTACFADFVVVPDAAAIPVVTIIGVGVALLISGAIVTETVFALPGIGRLTVDAILRRDYPIIQGVILIFSAIYVLVNLAVDLSYVLFDPRIRLT